MNDEDVLRLELEEAGRAVSIARQALERIQRRSRCPHALEIADAALEALEQNDAGAQAGVDRRKRSRDAQKAMKKLAHVRAKVNAAAAEANGLLVEVESSLRRIDS